MVVFFFFLVGVTVDEKGGATVGLGKTSKVISRSTLKEDTQIVDRLFFSSLIYLQS